MTRGVAAAALCASLLLSGACGVSGTAVGEVAPVLRVLPTDAPRRASPTPTVYAEVVSRLADRSRGLGGRESLAVDAGMLFVYSDARPRPFWMKDCLIALDIAFLDGSGRVLQIATLPPGAGKVGTEVPSVKCLGPVRYVLETRAGWLAEHGVADGDHVDVSEAVRGVFPD